MEVNELSRVSSDSIFDFHITTKFPLDSFTETISGTRGLTVKEEGRGKSVSPFLCGVQ